MAGYFEPIIDISAAISGMTEEEKKKLLNINKADTEGWMTLPKMTEDLAKAIIDYRESLGGSFDTVDDLWYFLPAKKHKKTWEKLISTKDEEE